MKFLSRIVLCACILAGWLPTISAEIEGIWVQARTIGAIKRLTPDIHITPVAVTQFSPALIKEHTDGTTVKLVQPIQQPIFTGAGRVILSSVSSYKNAGEETDITVCSMIARKNLDMLLMHLGGSIHQIYQGNATDLIIRGMSERTLKSFDTKKSLIAALNERKDTHIETVFDVYRRNVPTLEIEQWDLDIRRFFEQGHRAVVFLADDEQWYILDTIDGKKTEKPQLLTDYLPNNFNEKQWFIRMPGYSGVDLVTQNEFNTILPFLSTELQLWWSGKREYVTEHPEEPSLIGSIAMDDQMKS